MQGRKESTFRKSDFGNVLETIFSFLDPPRKGNRSPIPPWGPITQPSLSFSYSLSPRIFTTSGSITTATNYHHVSMSTPRRRRRFFDATKFSLFELSSRKIEQMKYNNNEGRNFSGNPLLEVWRTARGRIRGEAKAGRIGGEFHSVSLYRFTPPARHYCSCVIALYIYICIYFYIIDIRAYGYLRLRNFPRSNRALRNETCPVTDAPCVRSNRNQSRKLGGEQEDWSCVGGGGEWRVTGGGIWWARRAKSFSQRAFWKRKFEFSVYTNVASIFWKIIQD